MSPFWRNPVLGGLTESEYETWEFLGESMDWRALTPTEQEWYDQLNRKRGIMNAEDKAIQLRADRAAARRLMHHINETTPGGIPMTVGPLRGVVTLVAKVWGILIIILLVAVAGFQVSKATAEETETSEPGTRTVELPL